MKEDNLIIPKGKLAADNDAAKRIREQLKNMSND